MEGATFRVVCVFFVFLKIFCFVIRPLQTEKFLNTNIFASISPKKEMLIFLMRRRLSPLLSRKEKKPHTNKSKIIERIFAPAGYVSCQKSVKGNEEERE